MPTLEQIPLELFEEILKSLSFDDLRQLAGTNRDIRAAVGSSRKIVKLLEGSDDLVDARLLSLIPDVEELNKPIKVAGAADQAFVLAHRGLKKLRLAFGLTETERAADVAKIKQVGFESYAETDPYVVPRLLARFEFVEAWLKQHRRPFFDISFSFVDVTIRIELGERSDGIHLTVLSNQFGLEERYNLFSLFDTAFFDDLFRRHPIKELTIGQVLVDEWFGRVPTKVAKLLGRLERVTIHDPDYLDATALDSFQTFPMLKKLTVFAEAASRDVDPSNGLEQAFEVEIVDASGHMTADKIRRITAVENVTRVYVPQQSLPILVAATPERKKLRPYEPGSFQFFTEYPDRWLRELRYPTYETLAEVYSDERED